MRSSPPSRTLPTFRRPRAQTSGRADDLTVIICAYNEERFLPEALASIRSQSAVPAATIVIDDGSSDDTRAIAEASTVVTHVIAQKNAGLAAARNRAMQDVRTPFFLFLDADDGLEPHWLATAQAVLSRRPQTDLVIGTTVYTDEDGVRLTARPSFRPVVTVADLVVGNHFGPPSGPAMRTTLAHDVGGYRADMRFAEDWEFWRRLVPAATQVRLDTPMLRVRQRRGSMTRSPLGAAFEIEPALLEGLDHAQRERMRAHIDVNVVVRRLAMNQPEGIIAPLRRARRVCPELARMTLMLEVLARMPAPARMFALRSRRKLRRTLGRIVDGAQLDRVWPRRDVGD